MNRKGQGLSVNLIILVAIGLIVLVIAIVLIGRSGKNLSENAANTCIAQGGTCRAECGTDRELGKDSTPPLCPSVNNAVQHCCRYNYEGTP